MRGQSIEDLASFSIEASRALKVVCTNDHTLKEAMLIRSLIDGLLPLQFRAHMRILMESRGYSTLKPLLIDMRHKFVSLFSEGESKGSVSANIVMIFVLPPLINLEEPIHSTRHKSFIVLL